MNDRNVLRGQIQDATVNLWADAFYRGYGIISMGVGKSRIIAMAILRYLKDHPEFDYKKYDHPIVVLVNSSLLRDSDLPKELKKWKVNVKVKIVCYQTAYRWRKSIGLLIADELDYAITDGLRYLQVFTKCTYDAWLGLSGTLIESKEDVARQLFGNPPFIEFSLEDAQNKGLINKTDVWVHLVPLYKEPTKFAPYGEMTKYKWIQRKINEMQARISEIYDTFRGGRIPYEENISLNAELAECKAKKEFWESRKSNPNSRLNMMHSAISLADYAKVLKNVILKDFKNKVIVFGELTSEVDSVSSYAYHGKKSDGEIIEKFNAGEVRELGVVRKVNRGINFEDLNHAIIHSYTSSVTNAAQAYIGRMVRLDPNEVAKVHFLASYYISGEERVMCQNYTWLEQIFTSKELAHLNIKFYEGSELLNLIK